MNRDELDAEINAVLANAAQQREVDLLVTVRDEVTDQGTAVFVRAVSGAGAIVLSRDYLLTEANCPSGVQLLASVLERFVTGLPVEQWTLPPDPITSTSPVTSPAASPAQPPEPPAPTRSSSSLDLGARFGVHANLLPTGGDVTAGLTADLGGRHRFATSVDLRVTYPQQLGNGKFTVQTVTLGAGWRADLGPWRLRAELRAGPLLATGFNFQTDHHAFGAWLDLAASAAFAAGPIWIGAVCSVAPVRDRVVSRDGGASRDLPLLQVGLTIAVPLGEK